MAVIHDDVRIMPSGDLTDTFMRYECTDYLFDDENITNKPVTVELDSVATPGIP